MDIQNLYKFDSEEFDLNDADERRSLSQAIGPRYLKIFESRKEMHKRPSFRKIYQDFSDSSKLKLNILGTPVLNLTRRLLSWLSEDDSEHRTDFLEDESNRTKFQKFLRRIYRAKYVVWLGEDKHGDPSTGSNDPYEWNLKKSKDRMNLTFFLTMFTKVVT